MGGGEVKVKTMSSAAAGDTFGLLSTTWGPVSQNKTNMQLRKVASHANFQSHCSVISKNNSHEVQNVLRNKQTKRGGTVTDICTRISQNIRVYNSFPRPTYTLTTVTKLSFAKTRIITWGTLVIWHLILLHQTRSAFHPKNITKKLKKNPFPLLFP